MRFLLVEVKCYQNKEAQTLSRTIGLSYKIKRGKKMKELKALEILKDVRNTDNGYDHRLPHEYDEAIAELEALQTPKTCDGCECYHGYAEECMYTCSRGYDDKFKPKAKQ